MTIDDWMKEAQRRFGMNWMDWKFICPSCGHIASVRDWKEAGAPEGTIAFSCIGRWIGASGEKTFRREGRTCNYAGGGLIGLNPVEVEAEVGMIYRVFQFAPAEQGRGGLHTQQIDKAA